MSSTDMIFAPAFERLRKTVALGKPRGLRRMMTKALVLAPAIAGSVACHASEGGTDGSAWDRARAVFAYDDASRGLVLGFKHADRLHAAPAFGRWLVRDGAELIGDAEMGLDVLEAHYRDLGADFAALFPRTSENPFDGLLDLFPDENYQIGRAHV